MGKGKAKLTYASSSADRRMSGTMILALLMLVHH